MSKRLYSDIVKIGYESTDSSEDEIDSLASLFLVFFLLILTKNILQCNSKAKWSLRIGGWNWFNWYYYWYWRHGRLGKISDSDTICQRLWGLDNKRAVQGFHYDILLQSKISNNSTLDKATRPLFSFVNLTKLKKRRTYKAFIRLLEDLQPSNGKKIDETAISENIEELLSVVVKTHIFRQLYWYLVRNSYIYPNMAQFKDTLRNLWFNQGKSTDNNLTAFQKVFVGENVDYPNELSVRNWIQFYLMERKGLNYFGNLNYYQYDPKIISVMFTWKEGTPLADNMLIGTSPEYELGLYTLCFFTNPTNDCECKTNTKKIIVKTKVSNNSLRILNSRFEIEV
ncbi:poly(U)-specific endoribonuclease-A-like [Xenia sp. Carnegie-2017]|uniref:poly(U)-specific endoribonuclease-A-like n=1 Tax=Xenia sp. Carnegie-2017 TaxID=2897299 RepID=UPI001F04D4FA|nr:poly(U)-specific endoribonuclease-A-like [Xenia sp. Carnegie-2017]